MTKDEKLDLLKQVFPPSSPIKQKDFFYGRMSQLERIAEAINEDGQHAILYGERGVGKTSLANIMATSYTNTFPIKITCNRQDNFKSLWTSAFKKIKFSRTTTGLGFNAKETEKFDDMGSEISSISNLRPNNIVNLLNQCGRSKLIFYF